MATGDVISGAASRVLLLWLLLPLAACHLNVLISQAEVMKLLGLDAELYYVRDGIVNSYAMNFIVPVPAHVTDLQFMWQSLGKNGLPYVMSIQYESRGAMLPPQVNISETGLVPITLQTFRVRLPCTGMRSAEIEVRIQLNISDVERHRNVSLNFKRNKICLKGLSMARNESMQPCRACGTAPSQWLYSGEDLLAFILQSYNPVSKSTSMQASGVSEGAHPRAAAAVLYVAGGCTAAALALLAAATAAVLALLAVATAARLSTVPARNESMQASGVGEGAHPRDAGAVLYVAGGCAAAALALLAAATAASSLYRRGSKARHHDSIHTSYTTAAYGSHQNVLLRLDTLGRPPSASGSYATIASLHKFPFGSRRSPSPYATTHIGGEHVYAKPESRVSYYAASNLTHVSQQTTLRERVASEPADQLRHLSTARSNIKLEMLVHEGAFGRVYRGVLRRGDTYEEVVVKTVSEKASAMQAALLVAEGLRLSGLSHAAVLTPAAACADDPRRPLLVYFCATHSSNLKRWLSACRLGVQAAPLTRELVELGAQAACGLAYLHAHRLLHADLAARNCVVDEKLRLKISDNALARDLFPEEYHCLGDNENRPIKWMAPEVLLHDQFSTASDTWSLGVVLWELCTLGAQPLAELDASDVAAFVRDGYRPAQPLHCPDELFGLMSWCWSSAPPARPSAPQLLAALHDFRQALATYI